MLFVLLYPTFITCINSLYSLFPDPPKRARHVFWVNGTFFFFFSFTLKLKTGIHCDVASLHCHKTTITFAYHCVSVWGVVLFGLSFSFLIISFVIRIWKLPDGCFVEGSLWKCLKKWSNLWHNYNPCAAMFLIELTLLLTSMDCNNTPYFPVSVVCKWSRRRI